MSEERYLVAARKYRPQRFGDVVAQEHVCDTLMNAIARDRLGHAYLFSGPRGVGKTTVARILAKAINCSTPLDDRDRGEPCNSCDSCLSFTDGRNLNVIEIDAASHNKVDDARDLRDTVRVPPQGARKKVYIVDEVHMLTTSAFNALLKTLEEPPPYALFIFATTEPNKVIPTILSRCQRFDFRRIPVREIISRLEDICLKEEIKVDEASLMLIAQRGDGALRDSLSVFDQAVALCGTRIEYASLAEALGVVDVELFFKVSDSVRSTDSAATLELVQHVVSSGFDLQEFLGGLGEHFRNLYVAATMGDSALIEASAALKARYEKEAPLFDRSLLLRLLSITADTENAVRFSQHPRLQLELGLLKMTNITGTIDLRRALQKLEALSPEPVSRTDSSVAEAGGRHAAQAPRRTDVSTEKPPAETPRPTARKKKADGGPKSSGGKGRRKKAPSASSEADENGADDSEASTRPKAPSSAPQEPVSKPSAAASPEDRPGGVPVDAPSLFGPPALSKRNGGRGNSNGGTIEGSAARSAVAAPEVDRPHPAAESVSEVLEWLAYVKTVKSERIHVGSLLQHTSPSSFEGGVLLIDVPDDFHRRLLENQHDYLLGHARTVLSELATSLRFRVRADIKAAASETADDFDPYEYMQKKRRDNPVIRAIFDDFGGELVW